MPIGCKRRKKETVFTLSGYTGIEECRPFADRVKGCIISGEDALITINMSSLEGMHTSVLQVILSIASTLKKNGGRLRFIKPPAFLTRAAISGGQEEWLRIN